jgi:hypothetical protein
VSQKNTLEFNNILKTGFRHESTSATRNCLMNDGWIIDSGLRRETPQGNPAIVWVAL